MSKLEQACEVFRRVKDNPYSAFYRILYAEKIPQDTNFPQSLEQWRTIPTLTREDITKVPIAKRLFVPLQKVKILRCTSGTSGRGVMCIPQAIRGGEFEHERTNANAMPGERIVMFQYHYYAPKNRLRIDGRTQRMIGVDRSNLDLSAKLAAAFGVDSLAGQASELIRFAHHLRAYRDLTELRFVRISGERASDLQLEVLQRLYPKAEFMLQYNSAEAEGWVGATAADKPDIRAIEILSRFFAEVLNDAHEPVKIGEVGEIILTSLDPECAFPLIRYKTGDRARLLAQDDGRTIVEVLGRSTERIRVPGGEIHFAELERALRASGEVEDFSATVTEEANNDRIVTKLSVDVLFAPGATQDLGEFSATLSRNLRLNQKRSYHDAVGAGLFAPLACSTLPSQPGRKNRQLLDKR